MKIHILKKFEMNNRTKRYLVFILTFLLIFITLITSLMTTKYDLKSGDIAKDNIKANREIKDEVLTEVKIKQAVDSVPPYYNKDPEVKTGTIKKIDDLFIKIDEINKLTIPEKDKIAKLRTESKMKLSDEDFDLLLKLSKESVEDLKSALESTLSEIFDNNIAEKKQDDIKKAQETIQINFNSSTLPKTLRDLGTTIAYSEIKPNLFYDEVKTEELKKDAIKKVPEVVIKKDQFIVKEGEVVTKHEIELLRELGLIKNGSTKSDWYVCICVGVLVLCILFLQWFYLYKYYRNIYNNWSKLALISIITCVLLLIARSLSIISPFIIPLALGSMLLALLLNDKIALLISVVNCVFISAVVGYNIEVTLIAILDSVLGVIGLKKMQQRNDIIYSALYISVVNAIVALTVGFILSSNITDVLIKSGFAFIGGIISAILTIGFLPFFESTFDVVTTIKLLELSNPNHPLLKRLLIEAPGTYHHSILVGNLAEVAAEAVGGNPVLARVSAYYHDIGKIKRPYFFKENQIGNDNPHNKISPNLSTLIITSHVKDGIELAKEYKIPQIIQDVIEQHHGTSMVKYFYVMMKNNSEKPEEIKEDDFKYPGPAPKSKESAIIMLADGVEAAVRSITDPTKGKIEEMVNNIIKSRLSEEQLDNCDLTFKDIGKIRKAFVKTLLGIYHQRIEYPTEKFPKIKNKE